MSRNRRERRKLSLGLESLDDRIMPSPTVHGLAFRPRAAQIARLNRARATQTPFRAAFRAQAAAIAARNAVAAQQFRPAAFGTPVTSNGNPVNTGGVFTDTSGQQVFYQLRPTNPTVDVTTPVPDTTPPGYINTLIPNQPFRNPSVGATSNGNPVTGGGVYTDTSGQTVYYQTR